MDALLIGTQVTRFSEPPPFVVGDSLGEATERLLTQAVELVYRVSGDTSRQRGRKRSRRRDSSANEWTMLIAGGLIDELERTARELIAVHGTDPDRLVRDLALAADREADGQPTPVVFVFQRGHWRMADALDPADESIIPVTGVLPLNGGEILLITIPGSDPDDQRG